VPGRDPVLVPGVPAGTVVDTNGAGDVHVGAFVAALARGLDPVDAVAAANAAGAAWVSLPGPAR
jgi:sugar/nucleoside kinase (ribokinase family)